MKQSSIAFTFKDHLKELKQNKEFAAEWEKLKPEYEIARAIINARIKMKLTQKQLADKMNTKQSVISRVERAQTTATVSFLQRFAKAVGAKLKISFEGI